MSRRRLLLGVATFLATAVALTTAALLLCDDGDREPRGAPFDLAMPSAPPKLDARSPTARSTDDERGDANHGSTDDATDRLANDPSSSSPDERQHPDATREQQLPDVVPTDGPTLIVVERETGRPRPDAAVRLVQRARLTDGEYRGLVDYDAEAEPLIEKLGDVVELDALATVQLPWGASDALVFVVAGDRQLRRSLRLDEPGRKLLRLVRHERLTLVTADPNGRRQGDVPIELTSLAIGAPPLSPARTLLARRTDADGEIVLAHGAELLDEHLDADGLATRAVIVASLAFPCRDPRPTLIDPRTGCKQPVVLVTPPRSTLRLRAKNDRGDPFERDVTVHATCPDAAPSAIPVEREWSATIAAGGTLPLMVESGAAIHLEAQSSDGACETNEDRLDPMTRGA